MKQTISIVFSGFIFIIFISFSFGQEKEVSKCPKNMVKIPAGNFMSGRADNLKEMFIDIFCIDRFETTQSEYEQIMNFNPSHFPDANRPVEKITWEEARDYCIKIKKRLPTEWEWEKAAKAGSKTNFYWGNNLNSD